MEKTFQHSLDILKSYRSFLSSTRSNGICQKVGKQSRPWANEIETKMCDSLCALFTANKNNIVWLTDAEDSSHAKEQNIMFGEKCTTLLSTYFLTKVTRQHSFGIRIFKWKLSNKFSCNRTLVVKLTSEYWTTVPILISLTWIPFMTMK